MLIYPKSGLPGHIPDMMEWNGLYDTIFMVDISFNDPLAMEHLCAWFGDFFIWCDHHKPAIEVSKEYNYGGTPGVVMGVKKQKARLNDMEWKYEVTVCHQDRPHPNLTYHFNTNQLYQVGDTAYIGKIYNQTKDTIQ